MRMILTPHHTLKLNKWRKEKVNKRYVDGNTFNEIAYDRIIPLFPELEEFLASATKHDLDKITDTKYEVIILPKSTKTSGSMIGCGNCHTILDGELLDREPNHVFKCYKCGYEFFEYNQRITQLEKTQLGLLYRALQGIGYYCTRTIENAYAEHLNQKVSVVTGQMEKSK
jgi:hypothetical protein